MHTLFVKYGCTIFKCPSCGLAMTDLKRPYREFVKEHYSRGYFTGDPTLSAYVDYEKDKPFIVRNFRKYFQKIEKWKPSGTLLDVGCALGFFVEMALARKFDAYGFDPSSYASNRAKELVGVKRIQTGTIHDVMYRRKKFDVITMFDVFEHLDDPRRDLRKLNKMLDLNGIIVIATGDTNSLLARILKRRWTFYIPPQHLFFFSRSNLTTLLKETGFEPFEWFRIGKWLSARYVLHLARTTGESKFASRLYRLIDKTKFASFPLYLPVGDNMVVIARKTHGTKKMV